MSDRLAVFNEGRIEQIGTPGRGLRASGDGVRRRLRRRLERRSSATAGGFTSAPRGSHMSSTATATASQAGSRTSSTSATSRATSSSSTAGERARRRPPEPRRPRRRRSRPGAGASGCAGVPEHAYEIDRPKGGKRGVTRCAGRTCSSRPSPRRCACRRRRQRDGLPTSSSKARGTLNLIAWEGYPQPQWVKPFEKQTGCQVHAKYAGSSDEMVTLMRQGGGNQYDMVSASGDASLRLIYGKDVQPVNPPRSRTSRTSARRSSRRRTTRSTA